MPDCSDVHSVYYVGNAGPANCSLKDRRNPNIGTRAFLLYHVSEAKIPSKLTRGGRGEDMGGTLPFLLHVSLCAMQSKKNSFAATAVVFKCSLSLGSYLGS